MAGRQGRKRNSLHAARGAEATRALEQRADELSAGMTGWLEKGDFTQFLIALDSLEDEAEAVQGIPLTGHERPQEEAAKLLQNFVGTSYLIQRLRNVSDLLEQEKARLADQLGAALAQDRALPMYANIFFRGLEAEGIGSTDIQSPPRGLIRAVAETIKEYRKGTRVAKAKLDPRYADAPVASWSQLLREIVGFRLEDIAADDVDFDVLPLPPSTDIATFTADGQRIAFGPTRSAMIREWSKVIQAWAARSGIRMDSFQAEIWALLLAHRMEHDGSDMRRYEDVDIASPWRKGAVVRMRPLPPPELDDDLPTWDEPPEPPSRYDD